jgi:hypothetical protein
VSRVGRERFEHDRKSNVPVILYAEFTAKPGSESQVQMLISDLAEKVRHEPGNTELTVYCERDNPRKFFVSRSTSKRPVSTRIYVPSTASSSTSSSAASSKRVPPS